MAEAFEAAVAMLMLFQIQLPTYIENVRDKLAENMHELWAVAKIDQGWTYGEVCTSVVFTLFTVYTVFLGMDLWRGLYLSCLHIIYSVHAVFLGGAIWRGLYLGCLDIIYKLQCTQYF